ncbi:MAG: hypothetical protein V4726_22750 [Verrucomicrobiota bacterium]
MKCPPVLFASAFSVAAGFAAVSAGRGEFWRFQSKAAAVSGSKGDGPLPGDDAAEHQAVGKNSGRTATGPALAAQFRALLSQLGLDPSWAEGLAAGDTSGFPDLLERMKALPDARKGPLRDFLLGRWAALDPVGGVAFFQSRKDEDGLADLFRQWQRLDFPAAAARAGEYGGKILPRTLCDKALLDPAGLLAWLADRPDLNPLSLFSSESEENSKALSRLAEAGPDKMLSWLRQLPEDKWDRGLVKILAAQLAKNGPDEAVAWARLIKDAKQSDAALTGVAGALAAASPERALSLLAALPEAEDYEGRSSLMEAMAKIKVRDGARAAELVKGMPAGEARAVLRHLALGQLLESDPAAAFRLSETPGMEQGVSWLSGNLSASAQTPESARRILEAAGEAKDSVYRESVAKEALVNWLEKEPASLAAYLREKGGTPLLGGLRQDIQKALAVQQWRDGGADPELLAIVGLPRAVLVESRTMENPAAAARGLESLEDPAARQRLAGGITKEYVLQDRGGAMAWAETVKDPELQATVWKAIAGNWVEEDSWQASQWIARLPEGQGRDGAVLAMAGGISKTDPDLAWKWALSIGDPGLKNQALSAAATAWSRKDAAALHQALGDGTLTPAEQQAVLEKLKNVAGAAH